MKKLVAFLLPLFGFGFVQPQLPAVAQLAPSTNPYSITFSLTENPISDGGKWLNGKADGLDWSNVRSASGTAIGTQTNGGYNDSVAVLKGTWPADQTVQATVYKNNPSSSYYPEVELWLRGTITAHRITGYEINFSAAGTYQQIVRWNGPLNSFTSLTSINLPSALANGDVLKATIVGNVITVYKNGIQVARVTDKTYSSGSPGIGFYHQTGGDGRDALWGFSDFTAVGSGTTSTPQAATPTFRPAGGSYSGPLSVTISCTTPSSTIYYTTGSSTPSHTSIAYHGAISISATTTVKAICTASGYSDSIVASATYTISFSGGGSGGGGGGGGITAVSGQNVGRQSTSGTPSSLAFPAGVTSGNQVIVAMHCYNASTAPTINPPTKASGTAIVGLFTQDGTVNLRSSHYFAAKVYRAFVNGSGSLTLSFSAANCTGGIVMMDEFHGITAVDAVVANTGTGSTESSGSVATSAAGMVLMTSSESSTANFTYSQSATNIFRNSTGASNFTGQAEYQIAPSAGRYTLTAATANNWAWWALSVAYK